MPKFVWTVLTIVVIIALILGLGFVGYAIYSLKSDTPLVNPQATANPTVNATAIAQYTPTPGPSSAQEATAVYLAKPDPYVAWTPGDAKLFINGLRDKAIVSEQDINIAAQLSSPGEGHICVDLRLFGKVQFDTYCKISLTWTEWALAYKPQNIEVKVEPGTVETDPKKMPLSADGTHYDQRAKAKVIIIIKDMGIVGPTTRFDQRFDFYQDVHAIWKLAMDLKEIIYGDDLRQKANQMTEDTGDLALADSFSPLLDNGLRSPMYSDKLYQAFVDNLTTPGQGHIYNRLLDYATLVANNREEGKDAGYSGLESLTVIVPAKPTTPCDYVYAEDMKTLVLPRDYCVYTYQVIGVTPDMQKTLSDGLKQNVPNVDYTELLKKLYSIR